MSPQEPPKTPHKSIHLLHLPLRDVTKGQARHPPHPTPRRPPFPLLSRCKHHPTSLTIAGREEYTNFAIKHKGGGIGPGIVLESLPWAALPL